MLFNLLMLDFKGSQVNAFTTKVLTDESKYCDELQYKVTIFFTAKKQFSPGSTLSAMPWRGQFVLQSYL